MGSEGQGGGSDQQPKIPLWKRVLGKVNPSQPLHPELSGTTSIPDERALTPANPSQLVRPDEQRSLEAIGIPGARVHRYETMSDFVRDYNNVRSDPHAIIEIHGGILDTATDLEIAGAILIHGAIVEGSGKLTADYILMGSGGDTREMWARKGYWQGSTIPPRRVFVGSDRHPLSQSEYTDNPEAERVFNELFRWYGCGREDSPNSSSMTTSPGEGPTTPTSPTGFKPDSGGPQNV